MLERLVSAADQVAATVGSRRDSEDPSLATVRSASSNQSRSRLDAAKTSRPPDARSPLTAARAGAGSGDRTAG